jgi:hypothetical protein|tara:strand:- start:1334 stop:1762 length:429 start_codon:yes stop_codon:yes gene_type:complete
MEKRETLLYLTLTLSIIVLILVGVRVSNVSNEITLTGNVVPNNNENLKIGDKIEGNLQIKLNEKDFNENPKVLISLTKYEEIIFFKIYSLNNIAEISTTNPKYYSINLEETIPYTFEEIGDYELSITILEKDIYIEQVIEVR